MNKQEAVSTTNSTLGSYHNIHTLISSILHAGGYLKDKTPKEELIRTWGKTIYDNSKELIEALKVVAANKGYVDIHQSVDEYAAQSHTADVTDDCIEAAAKEVSRIESPTISWAVEYFFKQGAKWALLPDAGWVKCSERLPEEHSHVLLFNGSIMYGFYNGEDFYETYNGLADSITHWRELPKTPTT